MRQNSTYDQESDGQDNSNPYYKLEGENMHLGRVIRMTNGSPDQQELDDDEEGISVELDDLENDLQLCDPLDLNVELEEDEDNVEVDLEEGVNVEIESDDMTPQKEPQQNLRLNNHLASEERALAEQMDKLSQSNVGDGHGFSQLPSSVDKMSPEHEN